MEKSPPTLGRRPFLAAALAMACALGALPPAAARADDRAKLIADARLARDRLEATDARARALAPHARAVLVFPSVIKAGFILGGERGNGVLFVHGKPQGFYNMTGGSGGLQVGAQDFSYALFFMTEKSLRRLHEANGFSLGTLPSLVVIDRGASGQVDTHHDVYAFPFNARGLMASLSLEGTKITPIHPR